MSIETFQAIASCEPMAIAPSAPAGRTRSPRRRECFSAQQLRAAAYCKPAERLVPSYLIYCADDGRLGADVLATVRAKLGYPVEPGSETEPGFPTNVARRTEPVFDPDSSARLGRSAKPLEQLFEFGLGRSALALILVMAPLDDHRSSETDDVGRPIDLKPLAIETENSAPRVEPPKRSSTEKGLTPRERDVLTWVARGKTSADIAVILGLSERTINFHCDNAVKRLDVLNRTQAVAKAITGGLIGI